MDVSDYYSCHHEGTAFQADFQIHLKVRYGYEEYIEELNRIKDISIKRPIRYDPDSLSSPAYVAVWNWKGCYEYAICHYETQTIDYVYFQFLVPSLTKLDKSILPKKELDISESDDNVEDIIEAYEDDQFTIYD